MLEWHEETNAGGHGNAWGLSRSAETVGATVHVLVDLPDVEE